jgi:CspA family cold shock protein
LFESEITDTDLSSQMMGGKDVFFHAQSLVEVAFDDLQEGDAVTFDVEQGPKGPAATNVRRA